MSTKKGHGHTRPKAKINNPKRIGKSLSAPINVGVVFPRPDTPFFGDGDRIQLTRAEGYTPAGRLSVPFRFQLPPTEQVSRVSAFNWANFDVLDTTSGSSERSRPGGRRLKTVSLSSAFLTWEPAFQVWTPGPGLLDPILATRELQAMCDAGMRFRLRVWNPNMYRHDDVNMVAVMTQCTVTEQPGEPDTRYVAIDFQEYRATDVERNAIHNVLGPWTHTIKDGDSLYKLSTHYYKRKSDWKRIALANKGMEHQPPSHNLINWRKKHHRKTIHIPQATNAKVPVAV